MDRTDSPRIQDCFPITLHDLLPTPSTTSPFPRQLSPFSNSHFSCPLPPDFSTFWISSPRSSIYFSFNEIIFNSYESRTQIISNVTLVSLSRVGGLVIRHFQGQRRNVCFPSRGWRVLGMKEGQGKFPSSYNGLNHSFQRREAKTNRQQVVAFP